jgi:hypothetical protein
LKNKLKIIISTALLFVIVFTAIPKVYFHNLLGHTHTAVKSISDHFSIDNTNDTQDCNYKKFDTSVYYTVFKFILNYLPLKETKRTSFYYKQKSIVKEHYLISPLRGPPAIA